MTSPGPLKGLIERSDEMSVHRILIVGHGRTSQARQLTRRLYGLRDRSNLVAAP